MDNSWTRCSCGHLAQDHTSQGLCEVCRCEWYDGHKRQIIIKVDEASQKRRPRSQAAIFDAMPEEVKIALRDEGNVDEEGQIRQIPDRSSSDWCRDMTEKEIFDLWCDYEGLIGYGPKIRAIQKGIKEALND